MTDPPRTARRLNVGVITTLLVVTAGPLLSISGCAKDSSPTNPGTSNARLGTTVSDVTYCTADGVALTLDVHYPTQSSSALFPVIVYIHGGQLIKGNKNATAGSPAAMWKSAATPRGYILVSINYRLGPTYRFPAMIEDAKCAIRYLRANASTYSLDPNRIGVTGTSSGGTLAALVATTDANAGFEGNGQYGNVSSRVRAAVIEYGADMDLTQPAFSAAELEGRLNAYPQPPTAAVIFGSTVINHVSGDDPPFYFIHGDHDGAVDAQDNVSISARLQAVGVVSSFRFVVNGVHGWDSQPLGPISPTWEQILQDELAFFDTYVKN